MSAEDDEPPQVSPRRLLVALLAFALAIAVTLLLVRRLQQAAQIQDCVAAGRTNCAPIQAPTR